MSHTSLAAPALGARSLSWANLGVAARCVLLAASLWAQAAAADPLTLDASSPAPQVTTPGGCVVAVEGADAAWRVTLPGGPSMRVALDADDNLVLTPPSGAPWRLPGTTSFILPDGAKVTLGLRMDRQRGLLPENLHIAHGDHDVIISGLSKGTFKATSSDARPDNDPRFADGDYLILAADGRIFSLPAAQVAAAKAGKAPAALASASPDGHLHTQPLPQPLPLPAAALPLLIEADPD
jgi:hypothetical protein